METAYDKDGIYLGKLADVFGDPTRRGIYRHLRGTSEPLSASEVAAVFGVHRTVARAHLEKLAALGLVESGTRRRAGGGRPAKTYVLTGKRLEVMLPPRHYERLSRFLLRLIDSTIEPQVAGEVAFALGREFGAETAADIVGADVQPPVKLAPRAVVAWMDEAGYNVSLDDGARGVVTVEVHNCVYSELAEEYPDIVCPFDRGTVCGMLGVEPSAHTQTHSMSAGDAYCRHEFRL
ncbi:MAG: helix-turn-helix domain-containing protein [Actinobacteria bacterium]|nr:helix-turn-helix domain-containing protein [Actinomycetota bacterium]